MVTVHLNINQVQCVRHNNARKTAKLQGYRTGIEDFHNPEYPVKNTMYSIHLST